MKPTELAERVGMLWQHRYNQQNTLVDLACARVVGPDATRYYNEATGLQLFETMTPVEILQWMEEEFADILVYLTMYFIRNPEEYREVIHLGQATLAIWALYEAGLKPKEG